MTSEALSYLMPVALAVAGGWSLKTCHDTVALGYHVARQVPRPQSLASLLILSVACLGLGAGCILALLAQAWLG